MYDHTLEGRLSQNRHQEILREAEGIRLAKQVQAHNRPTRQRIITPVRRAAHLVAALIR